MKKRLATRLIAVASAAVLAAGALTACGGSSSGSTSTDSSSEAKSTASSGEHYRTLEEIKESGKLVVGVFSDKAPFGYVDENGDYQGYDVYFANRLAKDLGVEVEYYPTDPASRVEIVNTGKVDITLANFTVTDERSEQVDFAYPYMKVALGVVSPDDAVITDVSQLEKDGQTLIVAKGTTAETYFEANYPEVKLQKYDQYADAYNALLDGRGTAFSTDNTEVLAWAQSNKGFTVGIDDLGEIDGIAPAVAQGNDTLREWINEEIVSLGKDNFFHEDYEKTLKSVYGDAADPDNLVVEGGDIDGDGQPDDPTKGNISISEDEKAGSTSAAADTAAAAQ